MDEFVRDAHNAAHYGGDYDGQHAGILMVAAFAQTDSAIKFSGKDGSSRIQLIFPEREDEAVREFTRRYRGRTFVLVATDDPNENQTFGGDA